MIRIVLTNAHDRVFQDPNVQLVFYPINKYPINNVGVAGDGRLKVQVLVLKFQLICSKTVRRLDMSQYQQPTGSLCEEAHRPVL